jgi:membrane protein YqaA with SNARE-associated domain
MVASFHRFYNWTLHISAHKHAPWWLFGIAALESSFLPIPTDITLLPLCMANRKRSFVYAFIAVAGAVVGGLIGYCIGAFLLETVGKFIMNIYGLEGKYAKFQEDYNEWGPWFVFASTITPIPYKVVSIMSGATHMNIPIFILMSAMGRTIRYTFVAGLLWKFGEPVQKFIEKHLSWVSGVIFLLLIIGFICLQYVL